MCKGKTDKADPARRRAAMIGAVVLAAALDAPAAGAAALSPATLSWRPGAEGPVFLVIASIAAVAVLWAVFATVRAAQREREMRRQLNALQSERDEAERVLRSEPQLLFIWRGRNATPEHIVAQMCGLCAIPETREKQADFAAWIAPESWVRLGCALGALRKTGHMFNIAIKTMAGERLEADGRTAGGLVTLRLRPLVGERLVLNELEAKHRALGRRAGRLETLLDAAPLAIWLRRDDGRIAWANNAYIRAVDGEALEQVVGQTMTLTGEGHDSADEKPAKRRDDGQDGAGAKPAKRRDRAIIGGVRTALEITEVETPEGRAGFAVDISALEACEKDLERHIRAHSSTLDHLTTAIAIFGPDQRLRFHNAAYAQLWTLDSRWLSTRPGDGEILDRVREQRLLPEHADYRDWKTRWLDIYTALEPREDWWYLPDGRTVRVVGEPHPFGGVIYLYEDATALITLESRYNELIGVQRETLDHLSEGIALFGADGRLKLFNPAYGALWALDKSFLDGEPHIDDVIASSRAHLPDDGVWNKLKSAVTALDDARRPSRARITRPDGRILDFAHVPLPDGNTLITHGDVTDSARIERALRERAEALEEADRLKSQFLSSISYELRTPLTTIIGFSDSLILGLAGELAGKQREYIGDILAAAQDLLTIIDSILDLTTIDAGAMELLIESVDIAGLLHETTQAVRDHLDSRAIGLDIDIPEEIGLLKADKRRLAQILFHLLTNAIGYSRDRGVIRLGARRESGEVVIWVEDTGGGMEQDFVATAFERFHSRPAASGHRGPGLGLALVKSLIELHEGTVTLRSKPSKGTVVTCRFPADGPDHRRYDPRNAALPVSRHSAGEWTRPRSAAR